jgi:lambda repressor-like predicted transcriptional regulator
MGGRRNTLDDFWKRIDKSPTGCWLWTGTRDSQGYGRFKIDGKYWGAHRLAFTELKGPIPDGLFVCHHCDVPACINPEHLYAGTHDDNMRDVSRRERNARILDWETAMVIRDLKGAGVSSREVAKQYGVSSYTVRAIWANRVWKESALVV